MKTTVKLLLAFVLCLSLHHDLHANGTDSTKSHTQHGLKLIKEIKGSISPKSVVYSGRGRFFAQNMMYQHSITVYDRDFNLIKTLSDKIDLTDYNLKGYEGTHRGAPVEAAFSPDGKYAWVSNYKMYGKGFENPATDNCGKGKKFDESFVYKINTQSLEIEAVVQVGCVPKYLAVSPNGKQLLVSNWCSGDLSIINTQTAKETKRIDLGRYPRGIAVDQASEYAYIALMGTRKVARLNLNSYQLSWIQNVGTTPRHLCLSPDEQYLYISLSREGKIARYDLKNNKMAGKVATGKAARSMVVAADGKSLYVVNYLDDTFCKVDANSMKVVQCVKTNDKPIGITYDPITRQIWVACYSGSIMVFQDTVPGPDPLSRIGTCEAMIY